MRPTIGWTERDVTQMLADFARPVGLHFLPEDRATVDRALVTGRTLLETDPASPLAVAIGQLADTIVARPAPTQSRARGGIRLRTAGTARLR
jgi:Flp pilus assembly CpaE family ATPase